MRRPTLKPGWFKFIVAGYLHNAIQDANISYKDIKEHEGFRSVIFTPGYAEDMWYRLEVLLCKERKE